MTLPTLPAGYERTPASNGVIAEAAAHMQAVVLAESGRLFLSVEDYENFWRAPYVDPERDVALVRDATGALAAQAVVFNRAPYTDPGTFGVVGPEHTGRGLGSALVAWAEENARSRLGDAPDDAQVTLVAFIDPGHEPSVHLVEGHGFALDRYFLTMEIEFAGVPPAVEFPPGVALRPFTPDQVEAAVAAATDAFRDHYGFIDRPVAERLKEVRHAMAHPRFDPGLWWHLYDGEQIVANCWCNDNHEGDLTVGYVQSLGVRKPWRGRGLARNLLLHAFGEFRRRGLRGAALDVDAHSLTGATRLYESVGMAESHRTASYVKELRSGLDLATRTVERGAP